MVFPFTRRAVTSCGKIINLPNDKYKVEEFKEVEWDKITNKCGMCREIRDVNAKRPRQAWARTGVR
jgi:hypothetical protein